MTAAEAQPPVADGAGWSQSLSVGAPGIALMLIEDAHRGLATRESVHPWALAMTQYPVTAHPETACLYRGAPAVAFALHMAGDAAYSNALKTLDSSIASLTRHRLTAAHERMSRGQPPALREFDLISGMTGLGTYLLARHHGGHLLDEVLRYLVRLALEPLKIDGASLPGWWSGNDTSDRPSPDGGHANLGLAHGIAGPLALMATALRHGVDVPDQAEAIGSICSWLEQWRIGTGTSTWWPEMISRDDWKKSATRQTRPSRPSWCYGTPGLARAQQLAALALGDVKAQRHVEDALVGCITDERQLSLLTDASLCHGWAGLIQATCRAAADARGDALAARVPFLCSRLERYLERHPIADHDGLLEGRSGVRLARRTALRGSPACRWDACLLLDG